MSGAPQSRRRRAPKMFLVAKDLMVQDHLEGTIRLQRGNICQEQEAGKSRSDNIWVKVLDNTMMVKIEKQYLLEIPSEFSGLLEPISEPETRFRLLVNTGKLQLLAALPLGTPLWVQLGQSDELAEAELRYKGPLARGSSAVFFGVQLKGAAVGRGVSNGSYKSHQLFICPEASALFLPASSIKLQRSSHNHATSGPPDEPGRTRATYRRSYGDNDDANHHQLKLQQQQHRNGGLQRRPTKAPANVGILPANVSVPPANISVSPANISVPLANVSLLPASVSALPANISMQPRAAESQTPVQGPASPTLFLPGQRVLVPLEDGVQGGEVRYCGPLPDRASAGLYVGVLLDAPAGNWDGHYKGEKLCHIPSHLYGQLLPISKVSSESRVWHQDAKPHAETLALLLQTPRPILKSVQNPVAKPSPTLPPAPAPKVALMPPTQLSKQPLKAPATPLPVLTQQKPHPLPPAPPPKPKTPPSSPSTNQPLSNATNGREPPRSSSPLSSPGNSEEAGQSVDGDEELEAGLEVGSMVEVNETPLFGVIRWIGWIRGVAEPVAGIELDHELVAGTDGSYLGERRFRCPANKGLFVKLRNCRRDSRFPAPETPVNQVERCNSIAFAEWGSERVEEPTPPVEEDEAKELYQGCKRGIQGHLNSCYLDASLFSLFSCCHSADWVLYWPTDPQTSPTASHAQDLLRCEIVNPLRRFGYVCASKTMALRRLLEAENSNTGFTSQEKDPEEFINKLFQLLGVEPLLRIRSASQQAQEFHLYQLFPPSLPPSSPTSPLSPTPLSPIPLSPPPGGRRRVSSVQALLETSFLHARLKFVEAPSCLLLLMPRFGKDFKMFDAILPTLSLDVTDLLDDSLRQCSICQAVAEWECLQCYEDMDITPGRLKQYCPTCNTQVHSHKKRCDHVPTRVAVPGGVEGDGGRPWSGSLQGTRQRMELAAVTCIETSHYVSFVRHGPRPSDWLFFDSMADREGGENGFNIPRVTSCPEVGRYLGLAEGELARLDPAALPGPARRLLCDAYMCFYQSPELSLYR